jgi:carbamoyltransferase
MLILGINAYHGDSAACLVDNGRLVCAIEEERIRRIKHWAGLPTEAIRWCLDYAGVDIRDVEHIAISRNPYARIHKKITRILTRSLKSGLLKDRLANVGKIKNVREDIARALGRNPSGIKAKIHNVEHHRAHIGSTFLVSPFEEATCVTIDGFGDFVSAVRAVGSGNMVRIIDAVEYPHSLGIFYTAFTQYLGFWKYGDEYKVMGLSALGEPSFSEKMKKIVNLTENGLFRIEKAFFLHDSEGVEMTWLNEEPRIGRIFSELLAKEFGPPREKDEELTRSHMDISASIQWMYENAFFHVLNDIYERIPKNNHLVKNRIDTLCLAGGCIQNSLANGKIFERTPFNEVYIPPAAHDAGTAVGAAFWVWNVVLGRKRDFVMESPFWGPSFGGGEIRRLINERCEELKKHHCVIEEVMDPLELCRKTARHVSEGKVVGWFQGRTEWGPRALGNRSIVVDPRRKEMKDVLNARIKRREWFRPFAPSVLVDWVSEWFEESYPVPFMEKVYRIRPGKRDLIPAVCHFDGTGRLQTISREMNPLYYALIEEFYKITGVPVVLNTSFNENEPIVNTPQEAIDCFLRTRMDVLVMERFILSRTSIAT